MAGESLKKLGSNLQRAGLVLVLGWIGAMKFTSFEAAGIKPLIETSPLMSWTYRLGSEQAVSNFIGAVEILAALLIAARFLSPKLSLVGGAMAIGTFATTITFLFTLPGWEASLGGFPALSGSGGFLLKDVILLGAAVWVFGESLDAQRQRAIGGQEFAIKSCPRGGNS